MSINKTDVWSAISNLKYFNYVFSNNNFHIFLKKEYINVLVERD